MAYKPTDPAPKYGPTSEFGDCEADSCRSVARTSCDSCGAHVCFGHADHDIHAAAAVSAEGIDRR